MPDIYNKRKNAFLEAFPNGLPKCPMCKNEEWVFWENNDNDSTDYVLPKVVVLTGKEIHDAIMYMVHMTCSKCGYISMHDPTKIDKKHLEAIIDEIGKVD